MQKDNNTETQYTDYEWQIYYKLQDMNQKLNGGERGLDPISLAEAEWYMEKTIIVILLAGLTATFFLCM